MKKSHLRQIIREEISKLREFHSTTEEIEPKKYNKFPTPNRDHPFQDLIDDFIKGIKLQKLDLIKTDEKDLLSIAQSIIPSGESDITPEDLLIAARYDEYGTNPSYLTTQLRR